MTRPLEVRLALALLSGAALVFLLEGLVLQLTSDPGFLRLPLVATLLAALVVGTLWARWRLARLAGGVFGVLVAVLHVMIALSDQVWWLRVVSGLLAAANVYAVVLLLTRPADLHFGGPRD
ncbi:hypothetical protein [Actinokineospora bangkokensis]|uniref:Integral membrane protein n=1 Tax=Actinokineospora bangkokensis TaxID=1193682 RepID=A0A1Q9LQE4_9PSEU|nr:hypothetical protein [Actinokineospora bangkokensis]OLR94245.1 hypothetical protein BJP25_10685 [Actinokineospora bangkokensis]